MRWMNRFFVGVFIKVLDFSLLHHCHTILLIRQSKTKRRHAMYATTTLRGYRIVSLRATHRVAGYLVQAYLCGHG